MLYTIRIFFRDKTGYNREAELEIEAKNKEEAEKIIDSILDNKIHTINLITRH